MRSFILTISLLFCFFINTTINAQTLPDGVVLPENISAAECFVSPPNQSWTIAYSKSLENNLSPYQNAVVGDIDGDGIVEILLSADPLTPDPVASRNSNKIAIYKGNNIQAAPKIITTVQPYTWDAYTKYAIARTTIASKDTVLIVVAERDCYLRAYNYNGNLVWTSDEKYNATLSSTVSVSFADLNKDGIPEVMISNKVFDSTTGKLLCKTPTELPLGVSIHSIPIAEDVYLDGQSRFILGNSIYKPNSTLNSLAFDKTITASIHASDPDKPATALSIPDGGRASVADIDLDGNPDLIISLVTSGYTFIYIADPFSGVVKASKIIPNASSSSYPFVGDIDGDGAPEIVFITYPGLKIYAYKYASGNPVLQKKWELSHTDKSGLTTMTLFDFNQDGISEIVYRDETHIRIINGSLIHHQTGAAVAAPYNLAEFKCSSGTSTEYPVVADIDNDGQAEIVIVGGNDRAVDSYWLGYLWVFKSGDLVNAPWASARKVWNQYAYNSLNVNDNLSVPKVPMSPATRFAGPDGILDNANDVRPFNNFFQQQTSLNKNGMPLWLAANAQIAGTSGMDYNEATDIMTVTVRVKNEGEVAFQSPFYITVYKDNIGNSRKHTHAHTGMIGINAEVTITFDIPNYSANNWYPNNGLIIKLNDKGDGLSQQMVCDNSKDQFTYYGLMPTSSSICINDVKTLSCDFTISGGANSYQWQFSANNLDWSDIAGSINNNFTIPTSNRGIYFYRVVVKAGANTEYSQSVRVKVNSCSLPVNHNISNMGY